MSQPTVVLVHGAFAESAGWNGVLTRLQAAGPTIPTRAQRSTAERAGAHEVVELRGASHAVPASRPDDVADVVLRAAEATA